MNPKLPALSWLLTMILLAPGLTTFTNGQLGNDSCPEGQILPYDFNITSPSTFKIVPVVCINGVLGSICARGFDDQDAEVVCRSLGQFSGKAIYEPYTFNLGPVHLQDLNCSGVETEIQECQLSLDIDGNCSDGSSTAIVECTSQILPSCVEGQVFPAEVTLSSNIIQSVPIVCVNGIPGSICSRGFDDQDATVVCRSLGNTLNITSSGVFVSGGRVSTPNNSSGIAVRLQDLSCSGNESSLASCGYNTLVDEFCMDQSNIATVECIIEPVVPFCVEGQVFPAEVTTLSSNIIQTVPIVCVNGVPGSICSRGFDDQDATVVCRSLSNTLNITSSGGRVSSPNNFSGIAIRLQDLNCSGDESSLASCGYNTLVDGFCMDQSRFAAVECIIESDCVNLNITNGEVSYSNGQLVGSVASYSCDSGYVLTEGNTNRICSLSGWSGNAPTCHRKNNLITENVFPECPSAEVKENIMENTIQYLSSNNGVNTLGLLKSSPGSSCDQILRIHPGGRGYLYWINNNNRIQQQYCN